MLLKIDNNINREAVLFEHPSPKSSSEPISQWNVFKNQIADHTQKSRRITTSFCLTYSHHGHQTILSEETWNAFAYFAKNSSLDCPLFVDVTTQEMRLSEGENKRSTHSSSYRQIAKPKPTQQDTNKSKSRLDNIRKKDFSKVFICSLTKEEREHSIREMINEVKKEDICTTCNKKTYHQDCWW